MLYSNKLNNLEKISKFQETYNLSKPNQKENLNRSINSIKIELAILKKKFQQTKSKTRWCHR